MKACSIYHAKQTSAAEALLPVREELYNYVTSGLHGAIFNIFPSLFAFKQLQKIFCPIDSVEMRKYGECESTDESGLRKNIARIRFCQ